jgi:hypothetical protein
MGPVKGALPFEEHFVRGKKMVGKLEGAAFAKATARQGGRMTEDGGQMTEDGRQMTEGGRLWRPRKGKRAGGVLKPAIPPQTRRVKKTAGKPSRGGEA